MCGDVHIQLHVRTFVSVLCHWPWVVSLLCRSCVGELEAQWAELPSQLESQHKEAVLRELELFKGQPKKPGILREAFRSSRNVCRQVFVAMHWKGITGVHTYIHTYIILCVLYNVCPCKVYVSVRTVHIHVHVLLLSEHSVEMKNN